MKTKNDDLQKEPFFIAVGLEPHNIVQLLLLVSLFPCLFNNIHLMSDPEGNSKFCFLEGPDVSRDEVEGRVRNCAFLVANATKHLVLATRIS